MSSCLRPAEIERYFQRQADGESTHDSWLIHVRSHLETCSTCRAAVDNEDLFQDLKDVVGSRVPEFQSSSGDPPPATLPGPVSPIPGYRIEQEIHRGGQGIVYKATQSTTKRKVAVKLLLDGAYASSGKRLRFEREIDLVAQLKHPNIVTIYDSGSSEGRAFYSMEFVEGPTLDQFASSLSDAEFKQGRTSRSFIKRILQLMVKIGEAVGYAHRHGVIHRDLKPGNIIVNEEGEPQILDFGLAKIADLKTDSEEAHTLTGEYLGTPAYSSPEQVMGEVASIDTRSDIYSLGIILYELLTRRFPYAVTGSFVSVANQINTTQPTPPSQLNRGIDHELETILLKTLSKQPEHRYQTVEQWVGDIRSYLAGRPIEAKRDSTWYVLRKSIVRHWGLATSVAIVLISLAVALIVSNAFYQQAVTDREFAENANTRTAKALNEVKSQRNEAQLQSYVAGLGAAAGSIQLHDVAETTKRLNKTPSHLRGWEWYQFLHLLDDSVARIQVHRSKVTFAALAPDGQQLVSASDDRTLRLIGLKPQPETLKMLERSKNGPVAVSPSFRQLAVSDDRGKIKLIDVQSFKVLASFQGIGGVVTCVRFSSDGSLLAAGFAKGQMATGKVGIVVWDLESKEVVRQIPFQFWHINDIGFTADLKKLCAITFEGGTLWDLETGQRWQKLPDRPGMENCIAFDETNQLVLTGGADGVIYGWDPETQKTRIELVGHRGAVTDFAICGNGRKLVTCSRDKTIRIWDLSEQNVERVLKGHTWSIQSLHVIDDGRRLASASWDHSIRIWNGVGASRKHLIESAHQDQINSLTYSPNGSLFATSSNDQTVKIWSVGDFRLRRTLRGHTAPVQSAAFSPDGKLLASVGWNGQAILWDAQRWKKIGELPGHLPKSRVHSVAFSQDSQWLVTGASDNALIVWDAKSLEQIDEMKGHDDHIHVVNVTADNRFVVSAGHRSVKVWDTRDFSLVRSLERTMLQDDFSLAIHPQKNLVATGASIGVIKVWDMETGQVVGQYEGHSDEIRAVNFFPDGTRLISSSYDNTIRLWDTESGRELLTLFGYEGQANSVLFSRDGYYAIAGLKNGDIKIWPGIAVQELAKKRQQQARKENLEAAGELLE